MNGKLFRRILLLLLIPVISTAIISLSRYVEDPCRIDPTGGFATNGLALHVEDAFNKSDYSTEVSKINVGQYGCTIVLNGSVKNQSIKDGLRDIAEKVQVKTSTGRVYEPVKDVDLNGVVVNVPIKISELPDQLRDLKIVQHQNKINLDTIWVVFSGILVFFMNAGFAMLEAGFCRDKNSITVLAKNLIIFGTVAIVFWLIGFGLMFSDGNLFFGTSGFLLNSPSENSPTTGNNYKGIFNSLSEVGIPLNAKFFFHLTFASTATTIVSGAVAERIRFKSFFLFIPLFIILTYSIVGHWAWGGGWLSSKGFWDFAGSTVVHSVGGCAGLIGTIFLGPRLDKYSNTPRSGVGLQFKEKTFPYVLDFRNKIFSGGPFRINRLYPDNLSLSTLGCLILWLGWFGFNAGSTLEANYLAITHIILNTVIAGSAGGIASLVGAWIYLDKPSMAFLINGILGGCVSITAACAFVSLPVSAIIGFVGGLFVLFSTVLLDKLRIDDPVGAVPVHLAGGFWGTLAVGLFSEGVAMYPKYGIEKGPELGYFLGGNFSLSVVPQLLGFICIFGYTLLISIIIWHILSRIPFSEEIPPGCGRVRTVRDLRISPYEEYEGTNIEFDDKC